MKKKYRNSENLKLWSLKSHHPDVIPKICETRIALYLFNYHTVLVAVLCKTTFVCFFFGGGVRGTLCYLSPSDSFQSITMLHSIHDITLSNLRRPKTRCLGLRASKPFSLPSIAVSLTSRSLSVLGFVYARTRVCGRFRTFSSCALTES